jgi:hypothetical protein
MGDSNGLASQSMIDFYNKMSDISLQWNKYVYLVSIICILMWIACYLSQDTSIEYLIFWIDYNEIIGTIGIILFYFALCNSCYFDSVIHKKI